MRKTFAILMKLVRRRWVSFALLSIIVPMGLLAAFRLTGIIPEPPTPETITVDTVSWNMTRPKILEQIEIDQLAENFYFGNTASINFSVRIWNYHARENGFPSLGNDYLKLQVNATANVTNGFVHSLYINFSRTDAYAFLDISEDPNFIKLRNVAITGIQDTEAMTSEREAYVEATSLNDPKDCLLSIYSYWVLTDENQVDHWMTATLQVVYFNGTAYERVVVPIQLGVLAS